MSVYGGPEIANDGLVFAYDMGNTEKSWRGAPTTNLISSPRNLPNDRTPPASCGSSFTDFTTGGPTDGPFVRVTRVTTSPPADWPWQISYPSIAIGTSFKFSCYARSINGTVSTIEFSNPDLEEVSFALTPQWQRFSTTFTSGIQSNLQFMRINRSNANDKTIGSIYDVADAQIEVQPIVTPFVAGTRSNTQAVLDLAGNNTVTANSLTYISDGTFSFNGSGNNISMPSVDFSLAQTIEIWLKPEENDGVRRNPYNQAYGGYGTWTHEPSGVINYYYGDAGANASPYIGHTSGFSVAQNEIACVCTTRDTSTSWWYKNGIRYNSFAHSYGNLTTDSNNILIGTGYAGSYLGKIYAVKLYNRALSAEEVQQNFSALRGRFGI